MDSLLSKSRPHFFSLFLILITLAVFWQVSRAEFLNLDDNKYVVGNPHIREGLTWKGIRWALGADLFFLSDLADRWQPVTFLSRMVDFELYGSSPRGHHLTNLALHLANVLLVFYLLRFLTGSLWRSGWVAVLFAIHPLQVEAVAWVMARKDVLSLFFALLAMHLYFRSPETPSRGRLILLSFVFLLGLMTKSIVVTVPFLMILFDQYRGGIKKDALRNKWPLFVMAILYLPVPFIGQVKGFVEAPCTAFISRFFIGTMFYISKTLYPVGISVYIGLAPEIIFPLWKAAGSTIFLIAFSVFVVLKRKKFPHLMLGWFWYLIALMPVLGLEWYGSRYMYLPGIGLFIVIVWGLSAAGTALGNRFPLAANKYLRQIVIALFGGILLGMLTRLSFTQAGYWRNNFTLYGYALRCNSKNHIAHQNLGVAWAQAGNFEKAKYHFLEAWRLNKEYVSALNNLGLIHEQWGMEDEAIRYYAQALREKPQYKEAQKNLDLLLQKRTQQR